jgi:hypothetical protein
MNWGCELRLTEFLEGFGPPDFRSVFLRFYLSMLLSFLSMRRMARGKIDTKSNFFCAAFIAFWRRFAHAVSLRAF